MSAQRLSLLTAPAAEQEVSFMTLARNVERRKFRRHDLEMQELPVERVEGSENETLPLGRLVDISPGGIRIKVPAAKVAEGTQIRVRLKLPVFAGISPFIDHEQGHKPREDWTGWFSVCRVERRPDGWLDVAGRLADMDDMDRGMLGLYLSTQPMAE